MFYRALIATSALFLVSCTTTQDKVACSVSGGNLLQDVDFSLEAKNRRSKHWGQAQHVGEVSFQTDIDNGVLTITKIGKEPWFSYRQRLKSEEFAGQKMVFSADLKLDLVAPEVDHSLGDGGWMRVVARSSTTRPIMRSPLDHEPHIGKTDWQNVQVIVDMPAQTHSVDLSFLHHADGVMQVRNPFFGYCQ